MVIFLLLNILNDMRFHFIVLLVTNKNNKQGNMSFQTKSCFIY